MKKLWLWMALMAAFCSPSFAQEGESSEGTKVNLGVACSFSVTDMNEVDLRNLLYRGTEDEGYADYSSWYLEFSADILPPRERVSFSAGVRFTNRYAWYEKPMEDLYWLVNENGKTCDYVSLSSFSQRNYYLGVPLAFRVFFNSEERRVRPYLRLEACVDFMLSSANFADINKERMRDLYEDQIKEELGKPKSVYASASSAVGIRINCNNFYVNPEIILPRFALTDAPISFFDEGKLFVDAGLRVSVQFPVGKKNEVSAVETSYSSEIQAEPVMPSEDF